jgi:magnesium transporter
MGDKLMAPAAELDQAQAALTIVEQALAAHDLVTVGARLNDLHPSEIASLLESLPARERDSLWALVYPEQEGAVLSYVQDSVRARLLGRMPPRAVAFVTEHLDTDDAADILQDLPERVVEEVLRSMDEQNRERLASILSYPEDTAGGLMNIDTITVRSDVSLDVVIRYVRWRGDLPEKTDSLVVVDRHNRYLGLLPLTAVLMGEPDLVVGEVMVTDIAGIPATLPSNDVARLFEQRDLLSVAVVDDAGTLLGRITIDDVVDVIRVQGDHSLMSLVGLNEEDDIFAPVAVSTQRRAVWLGINLATCFLASWVIGLFEATIQHIVALAILMPVVASMGGIAGTQTLTIVIRALALEQIGPANARSLLHKELAVAWLNAALWAAVVGTVAGLWFGDSALGAVIALAMVANLMTAAFAGTLVPLTLKSLRIDPAVAGGVILTTFTDVMGFLAFLGLATLFLM